MMFFIISFCGGNNSMQVHIAAVAVCTVSIGHFPKTQSDGIPSHHASVQILSGVSLLYADQWICDDC